MVAATDSHFEIYGHIYETALPIFIKLVVKCLSLQTLSYDMKVNRCERFPLINCTHFLCF